MIQPLPTVTCAIAAAQMSTVLTRLSTFLLHGHYAFLHTFHSPEHCDIDIFDQQQRRLLRCTIQVLQADAVPASRMSAAPGTLAMDLVSLLHDLVH